MSLQFTHVHSVCRLKKLRNLPAHCYAVALCCVTITWQRIFKVSLQVTIVNALFRMWLLTSDIFDRWCSVTVTQWRSQANFLGRSKKFGGAKTFDFRRATIYFWGYRLSKQKMTTFSKNFRAWPPKRRCFILCEKKHDWICSSASSRLKNPL